MKQAIALFTILICSALLAGCFGITHYPKVRDVPTDVKPTLQFEEAQKELQELEVERDTHKARA